MLTVWLLQFVPLGRANERELLAASENLSALCGFFERPADHPVLAVIALTSS